MDLSFNDGSGGYAAIVTRVGRDFTVRWSCQRGDYLLWLRRDPFAGRDSQPQVLELWSMPNGAAVILTNRVQDFPPWFDLHPSEVRNGLVGWMTKRIVARDYPEERIDGPNIWRVRGGDRIVWAGSPQAGQAHVNGVLAILDCKAAVAVLADHPDGPLAFTEIEDSSAGIVLCRAAIEAELSLAQPRVLETEWQLG